MSCRNDVQADFDTAVNMTVGYVHRHLAQRPAGDISDTRWRYFADQLGPRLMHVTHYPAPATDG